MLFPQCLNGSSFSAEQAYNSFLHRLNTWKAREEREGRKESTDARNSTGKNWVWCCCGGSSTCEFKSRRPIPPKTPQSKLVEFVYPMDTLVETVCPVGTLVETVSNRYIGRNCVSSGGIQNYQQF